MISKNMKFLRKRTGMKQAELANVLGVSDKTICAWEHGRGAPKGAQLQQLAEILGSTAAELSFTDIEEALMQEMNKANKANANEPATTNAPEATANNTAVRIQAMIYKLRGLSDEDITFVCDTVDYLSSK